MKTKKGTIAIVGAMLILTSLSFTWWMKTPSSLEPLQFMSYVENAENGLKVFQQTDDFTFSLQYKPIEFLALLENGGPDLTAEALNAQREAKGAMQYYSFRISTNNGSELLATNTTDQQHYNKKHNYFISEMQNDLKLVDGSDTLNCTLYHFENSYGITNYNDIVLGFPKGKSGADKELIYDDSILDVGEIHLAIKSSAITNIPDLTLLTSK